MVCNEITTSFPEKVPEECSIATLNGGHQEWNSLTHWCITVVGQTTMDAPRPGYLEIMGHTKCHSKTDKIGI